MKTWGACLNEEVRDADAVSYEPDLQFENMSFCALSVGPSRGLSALLRDFARNLVFIGPYLEMFSVLRAPL